VFYISVGYITEAIAIVTYFFQNIGFHGNTLLNSVTQNISSECKFWR